MSRNTLTPKQNHELTNLILAEFTESKLSLSSFAEHATTKLSFPVSKTHISTRLEAFEIPINRPAPQVRKKRSSVDTAMLLAHETRINELEERINKMQAWINLTFPTYGGKALK